MKKKLQFLLASLVALGSWGTASAQTDAEFDAANAAIEAGGAYRVYTCSDGASIGSTKYYLKADGYLTADVAQAGSFTFAKSTAEGFKNVSYKIGTFTNGGDGNNNISGVNLNRLARNGSNRDLWEAQVFFLNSDGNYAVRSTNATSASWAAGAYWTVVEDNDGDNLPNATYTMSGPQYVWNLEVSTDEYVALKEMAQSILSKTTRPEANTTELNNILSAGDGMLTTPSGVQTAVTNLRAGITAYLSSTGSTVASGIDFTNFIVNATPTASIDGWTVAGGNTKNEAGKNVREFWNVSGGSISQIIANMPSGRYKLIAQAFTRTDMTAVLAAGGASMNIATIGSDVVNNQGQADPWFNAGNGINELEFTLDSPADIAISLTADNSTGDHWIVWRGFQLVYYGTGAVTGADVAEGAYYLYNVSTGKYLDAGANWLTHGTLSDYGLLVNLTDNSGNYNIKTPIGAGNLFCDATDVWTDGGDANVAWTFAEVTGANGKAYTISFDGKYLIAGADGKAMVGNDATDAAAQWMLISAADRKANALMGMADASDTNPLDLTFLIKSANIYFNSSDNAAWQGAPGINGERSATGVGFNAEKYHDAATDIYQIISGLPAGMYQVGAVGFYRPDGADVPATFYGNNKSGNLPHIDSGISATGITPFTGAWGEQAVDGGYRPESQAGAAYYFAAGQYAPVTIITALADGQDLRIGVKTTEAQNWVIFDQMTLAYVGPLTDPMLNAPAFSITPGSTLAADEFTGVEVTFPDFIAGAADPTSLSYDLTATLTDGDGNTIATETLTENPTNAASLFGTTVLSEANIYTLTINGTSLTDGTDTWTDANTYTTSWIVPGVNDIAAGTYFIQNKGAGTFLVGANDWGTQASVGPHAIDLLITNVGGFYQINSGISNGGNNRFLGDNLYVDSAPADWTFTKVGDDTYTISHLENGAVKYLVASGALVNTTADPMDANALWYILSQQAYVEKVVANGSGDMTPFIKDWDFGRNNTRKSEWQGSPAIGGDNANMCAEKYNTTYDVYQDVQGLPVGRYAVRVQGFYRAGNSNAAADAFSAGNENVLNALYYAESEYQEVSYPLMSICAPAPSAKDESKGFVVETNSGLFVPNTMTQASAAFTSNNYWNPWIEIVVGNSGKLRIGVKKAIAGPDMNWSIFDTFELKYLGDYDETVNSPMESGEYVFRNADTGNYLYVADANGNINVAGMPSMLRVLRKSVDTHTKTGVYYINTKVGADPDHAWLTDELKSNGEIGAFTEWTLTNVGNGYYTIRNANGYLTDTNTSTSMMGIAPTQTTTAGTGTSWQALTLKEIATKAVNSNGSSREMGAFIKDAYFAKNSTEASAWQGTPAIKGKTTNAVAEKKGVTFDVYQTITNLPAGRYTFYIQGLYDGNEPAYIYATSSVDAAQAEMINATGIVSKAKEASDIFLNTDIYERNLSVKVGADGILNIGMHKLEGSEETTAWMDNIEMYYNGKARTIVNDMGTSLFYIPGKHKVGSDMVDDQTTIADFPEVSAEGLPQLYVHGNDSIAGGLVFNYDNADITNVLKSAHRAYVTITDQTGLVTKFEADAELYNIDASGEDYRIRVAPGFFQPNNVYTVELDRVDYIDFTYFVDQMPVVDAFNTGRDGCDPVILDRESFGQKFVIVTGPNVTSTESLLVRKQITSQVKGISTGVVGVNLATDGKDTVIYNLAGQRLQKAHKGIYIIGGKKVVVK